MRRSKKSARLFVTDYLRLSESVVMTAHQILRQKHGTRVHQKSISVNCLSRSQKKAFPSHFHCAENYRSPGRTRGSHSNTPSVDYRVSQFGPAVKKEEKKALGWLAEGPRFDSSLRLSFLFARLWFVDAVLRDFGLNDEWNIKLAHTVADLNEESFWWRQRSVSYDSLFPTLPRVSDPF